MSDLISRAAAMHAFMGKPPGYHHTSYIVGELNCLPSIDAVPVVRCKDCKHCFSTDNDPLTPYDGESDWYCDELDYDWNVLALDPNRFYCANGEPRRESE